MNLKIASVFSMAVLLLGVTSVTHSAFAIEDTQKLLLKKDLSSIAHDYKMSILKAQADLIKAIEKANADAKDAVKKGVPMEKINAASKSYIDKARTDFKLAIAKAKADAKTTLLQIKSAVDQRNLS